MADAETRSRRILLYVDDKKDWHPAARLVGEFVRATGGIVVVTASLLRPGARKEAIEKAVELLGLPDAQIERLPRPGIIEYMLPSVARDTKPDVVVVGRISRADRVTSGLIAHLLARRTPASILIARNVPPTVLRILVCTEGQRHGATDFEQATVLAQAFGASLDVLHVVSQMGITVTGEGEIEEDLRDFIHSDAPEAEHLRDLQQRMRERGVRGEILVRSGLVVEEIIEAAREGRHDLLVIGAHESGSVRANLYEDFASLILRASPISTLIVRDRRQENQPK